jgi:hypothetical protein
MVRCRSTAGLRPRTGRSSCGRSRRCATRAGRRGAVPRNRGRCGRPRTRRRWSLSPRPRSPIRAWAVRPASATRSSSTSTRACLPTTARAAASSTTGARSPPRPPAGSPAMRPSSKTAARRGRSHLRSAARSARDRGCRFPGCENRRFLDGHHLHHWARGGPTTLDNLVLLCRHHHRLVHEGGWQVDEQLRFYDPCGRPFPAVPPLPRGQPDELVARNRDLLIDAGTCESGTGEACDLADAVDALLRSRHETNGRKWKDRRPGKDRPMITDPILFGDREHEEAITRRIERDIRAP